MNSIEKMLKRVKKAFPDATCDLDESETIGGPWFLDIDLDGYSMIVEWKRNGSFGLTAGRVGVYGEGADEVYPDYGTALRRAFWLLEHRVTTVPPLSDQLRSIRAKRHLTQEELAKRLDVKQSSISKLESRGETVGIRKLQEYLAAMGGQLTLRISFADCCEVEELVIGELRTGNHN